MPGPKLEPIIVPDYRTMTSEELKRKYDEHLANLPKIPDAVPPDVK